jgi:hypothetical protein
LINRILDYFRYEEGKEIGFFSLGVNRERTLFIVTLKFPVFVWLLSQYDFMSATYFTGPHVLYVEFRLMVRSFAQFMRSFDALEHKNVGWLTNYSLWQMLKTLCLVRGGWRWFPVREACSVITDEDIDKDLEFKYLWVA